MLGVFGGFCAFYIEIDVESMEDITSGLYAAVQFGQTVERLFVPFAVRVFANTRVHHKRRNAPGCYVRMFIVYSINTVKL